jgi:transposase-like protein
VTKEVEECMFEAVWEELRDAEETCEKSCLITHGEPSEWQQKCVDVCLKCWEMTKRGECGKKAGSRQAEHLHAVETILKLYGLWYHSYWHIDIDEKVLFVAEFKPPPT